MRGKINKMLWVMTFIAGLLSLVLVCLGVLIVITAPLSRLGLGEPGTGMSFEEFKKINAEIAASPWTPVPFLIVGFALIFVPIIFMYMWTRWFQKRSRT